MYKIDKEKCLGCGGCTITCPKGLNIGDDSRAQVIDEEELIRAGGDNVCPYGAIVLEDDEIIDEEDEEEKSSY
ncbi:MAG: 4Fe-4S dicluster domain-containing protein [Candidatus Pacebacteria bacterium]|nr:4Fe-4S dicluster domain-containing protein [Candidatus Paceibacterota bacterium]